MTGRSYGKYGKPLNEAEIKTLRCFAEGLSYRQTALATHFAFETVKWRMSNIFVKLGAKNKTHAVAIAIRSRQLRMEEDATWIK